MTLSGFEIKAPNNIIKLVHSDVPNRILKKRREECSHFMVTYQVNAKEAYVKCGKCETHLNPMWVLEQISFEESKWHGNKKYFDEVKKQLEERCRTKCQYCHKMTPIRNL